MKTEKPLLAINIAKRRKALNLNQEQLAEICGFHVNTIKNIERGLSEGTPESRATIAKALGCEVWQLTQPESFGLELDAKGEFIDGSDPQVLKKWAEEFNRKNVEAWSKFQSERADKLKIDDLDGPALTSLLKTMSELTVGQVLGMSLTPDLIRSAAASSGERTFHQSPAPKLTAQIDKDAEKLQKVQNNLLNSGPSVDTLEFERLKAFEAHIRDLGGQDLVEALSRMNRATVGRIRAGAGLSTSRPGAPPRAQNPTQETLEQSLAKKKSSS